MQPKAGAVTVRTPGLPGGIYKVFTGILRNTPVMKEIDESSCLVEIGVTSTMKKYFNSEANKIRLPKQPQLAI